MLSFDILSIFPEMFHSPFNCSLLQKAREKRLIDIHIHDIRHWTRDKHRMTDDYPYGGGGGMVMKVEPIARALDDIVARRENVLIVLVTPQGEQLTQKIAEELSRSSQIVLICGHYEGVDERVRTHLVDREISIGDYVLTGGELPAMVIVDAVCRLVPNVLGNEGSAAQDSFSTGLLEGPHYTRPQVYRDWEVPDVILSGDHKKIDAWRRRKSLERTLERRPDLLERSKLSEEDKKILEELTREKR